MIMKPARRIILICLIAAVLILPLPAVADEAKPTITTVYFEKDGVPYNGSVYYTVKCYGYQTERGLFPYRTPEPGETQTREMVFSYSATCPGYGCTIYEPYYHVDRKFIDRCDLEGTTDGYSFRIDNFSTQPYSQCYGPPLRTIISWKESREVYYTTAEYQSCWHVQQARERWGMYITSFTATTHPTSRSMILLLTNSTRLFSNGETGPVYVNRTDIRMDLKRYIAYLEDCNPARDPFCPAWMVDGVPLKKLKEFRPFLKNETHLEEHPCDTFLVRQEPALLVPAAEIPHPECLYTGACPVPDEGHAPGTFDIERTCATTHCMQARDYCEARFTIPPDLEKAVPAETLAIRLPQPELSPVVPDSSESGGGIPSPAVIPTPVQALSRELPIAKFQTITRSPVESLYCGIVQFLGGRCE